MPLFVSSYIPTTSISILSSIYSLFYACLNYMYVSTEKHLVVLRAHFFSSSSSSVINNTYISIYYIVRYIVLGTEKRKEQNRKLTSEHDKIMTKALSFVKSKDFVKETIITSIIKQCLIAMDISRRTDISQ